MFTNIKLLKKLILVFILALGFCLRFFRANTVPAYLYWDEASIGYEAFSVSQTSKDMHSNPWYQAIFPAYGDYKAPGYIWLTAISVKFLGNTILAVRLPAIIAGTLFILAIYLFVQALFPQNQNLPLLTAFLTAINPWHLQFSRVGFEAGLGLFFLTTLLWLLLKGRSKGVYLVMGTIVGVLGIYSYYSLRLVVPALALLLIIFYRHQFKQHLSWLTGCLILGVILVIPIFRSPYYVSSQALRLSTPSVVNLSQEEVIQLNTLRASDNFSLLSRFIHHRYILILWKMSNNIFTHFNWDYLFITGDPNLRHGTGFTGLFYLSSLPLLILGVVYLLNKYHHLLIFLAVFWLIALIPAAVPTTVPHALRSLNALVPAIILTAIGLNSFFLSTRFSTAKKIILIIYCSWCLLDVVSYLYYYHQAYPFVSAASWQKSYKELVTAIDKFDDQYDQVIVADDDRLYLYLLYFLSYPPSQIQAEKSARLSDFRVSQFGKYSVRTINTSDWTIPNALIAVPATTTGIKTAPTYVIYNSARQAIYHFYSTKAN